MLLIENPPSQNHFTPLEVGTLSRAQPQQLSEYIVLILAERRCQPADTHIARFRESRRCADRKPRWNVRATHLGRCTPRPEMGISRNVQRTPGDVCAHSCTL